jgi:putative toxin-antitoxin system antitoxin component (TIGR02293 family)
VQGSSEERVLDILGGPEVTGVQGGGAVEMAQAIREGFGKASLVSFKQRTALTDREIALMLGISEKTLGRIREGAERRLDAVSSDRLYRVGRIFALAEYVMESAEAAHAWLHSPQIGLGNRLPLDLLQTEVGTREVENLLGRIEHGVFS